MHRERQQAFKLIAGQAGLVLLAACLFSFASWQAAYSVILGGLCCVLPSFYFARQLFRYQGAQYVKQAVRAFYLGEVIKLVMIGALSMIVFAFFKVVPKEFFVGFIMAQIAFWVMPSFFYKRAVAKTRGNAC